MATISEALAAAAGHYRAGNLHDAEQIYREILAVAPHHAPAWNLLGVVSAQLGDYQAALDCLGRAIELNANEAAFHSNLGNLYQMLKRPAEAVASCRRALELKPDYGDAHYTLGIVLHRQGKRDEAIACYRRAVELMPNAANAHHYLGAALQESGRRDEALACFRRAVEIEPDHADIHVSLGSILQQLGKRDEAIACYARALELKPVFAKAHYNLGTVLQEQRKPDEALGCYHRALMLEPNFAEAHNNLGNVYRELGRLDEAVACYQRALETKPAYPEALYNLGTTLQEREMPVESVACYRRAVDLKPDYLAALGALVYELQHLCEWDDLQALSRHLMDVFAQRAENAASTPMSPFAFLALPTVTTARQQWECARQWSLWDLKSLVEPEHDLARTRPANRPSKITVGYLSGDFHTHATAMLMAELFEKHDRDRFSIVGYSYGLDDGSPMRRRLTAAFDRLVDVRDASFVEAAGRIAADQVDILVDLKGYTTGARTQIVELRPAPIQVNYLGYPGTMGASFVDYILVDDFIVPGEQQPYFTEKLVHLSGCYQVNDSQRQIGPDTPSRAECGLPEEGFVFCSFNNNYKITPDVFDVWMRLLDAVPGSVLWLLEGNRMAIGNLRREAVARGIDADRLVFAPRIEANQHLARHRLADLFLDTFPVNAHTTASDALWAGCPLVTIAGETFASRVAGSLLRALGLNELITTRLDEYQALALALAREPGRLAELHQRLQTARTTSALFDGEKFARSVEQAYAKMWEIHTAGEPPRAFRCE